MAFEDADLETDLFHARGVVVWRRGLVEARETDNQPTGAQLPEAKVAVVLEEEHAEQIVRALNRLPKAEAFLVEIAQRLRAEPYGNNMDLASLANRIEDWFIG